MATAFTRLPKIAPLPRFATRNEMVFPASMTRAGFNERHRYKTQTMDKANLERPVGATLERETERVEISAHDDKVRQTIVERVAIADAHDTTFISREEVLASSRARRLAKLRSQTTAS